MSQILITAFAVNFTISLLLALVVLIAYIKYLNTP